MARKCRFRFGLPTVFAGRPSIGGVGPGCRPVRFAAVANFGAFGSELADSVLSDSKSPQRIFRCGLNCCDGENISMICPTCQWLGAQIAECRERPKQQPYGNPCPCLAPLLRRNRARSERLAVKQLVGRNSVMYCTAVDGWMMAVFADAKSTVIISHKPPILPSAAAMHSLKPVALFLRIPTRPFDVSEAETRAGSEYLCLRVFPDGEGDRLSRV